MAKKCHDETMPMHPDHGKQRTRLKRVQGQIEGVCRMIDERRYCPDILMQLRAAAKALESIEAEVLGTHLQGCVQKALHSKNEKEISAKIDEIMTLLKR